MLESYNLVRPQTAPERKFGERKLGTLANYLKPGSLTINESKKDLKCITDVQPFAGSRKSSVAIINSPTAQSPTRARRKSKIRSISNCILASDLDISNEEFREFWKSNESLPSFKKHLKLSIIC